MDRPDIDRIKSGLVVTTKGPWSNRRDTCSKAEVMSVHADEPCPNPGRPGYNFARSCVATTSTYAPTQRRTEDARFIAASRTDVPDLVNYVEYLEEASRVALAALSYACARVHCPGPIPKPTEPGDLAKRPCKECAERADALSRLQVIGGTDG